MVCCFLLALGATGGQHRSGILYYIYLFVLSVINIVINTRLPVRLQILQITILLADIPASIENLREYACSVSSRLNTFCVKLNAM